jgi:hypothetical protein
MAHHSLPNGKRFLIWFHEHEPALRQNSTLRDLNTLIAIQLLPRFEEEPHGWEALAFLNRGAPLADISLAQHLAEWRSECPEGLRPFITKLAAIFAVKS